MSVEKYKFVSPGISINEVDNSQLDKTPSPIGPIIIGRTERGPGLKPVTLNSFSEYVEIFGNPIPGGRGGDVWRDGNYTAPTYAAYAVQAWLKNSGPCSVVRLLGAQHEDAITAGKAGWNTKDSDGAANGLGVTDGSGGAYGLFIVDSGSNNNPNTSTLTGALAAVWYINEGSIVLTGTSGDGSTTVSGTAVYVESLGADKEFRAIIRDGNSNVVKTTTFNFNINSQKYIRKVFNTNPILTNIDVTTGANTASYWLGQTYERHLSNYVSSSAAGTCYGIIFGLKGDAGTKEGMDFKFGTQAARTGWFFGQDLNIVTGSSNSYQPQNMTNLFRLHCLETGEWTQKNVKISIQDIKSSTNVDDPYGTFSVVLRKIEDNDGAIKVVERFSTCNLNPFSENYIAKKIGDRYKTWDDNERRYREYGNYDNRSKFIRIEMNSDVDAAAVNPELIPFGFYGPTRNIGFSAVSASTGPSTFDSSAAFAAAHVKGGANIVRSGGGLISNFVEVNGGIYTASFLFPALSLRSSSAEDDLASPTEAYFGLDSTRSRSTIRRDEGYADYLTPQPVGYNTFTLSSGETEYSWIFTLDDVSGSGGNVAHAYYASGSRQAGTSLTAISGDNYKNLLNLGFDRFTAPLYGGFNGLDITEKEPFNNTDLDGGTETTNYAFNSD